jgi:hypothetical protein
MNYDLKITNYDFMNTLYLFNNTSIRQRSVAEVNHNFMQSS